MLRDRQLDPSGSRSGSIISIAMLPKLAATKPPMIDATIFTIHPSSASLRIKVNVPTLTHYVL